MPIIFHLGIVQTLASGCCDFIAQCIMVRIVINSSCTYLNHPFYSLKSSKIYRCWIVWDQNIRVVIIPSLLAIAYIGQSIYLHLISSFHYISSSYLVRVRFPIQLWHIEHWRIWKYGWCKMGRRILGNQRQFSGKLLLLSPTFGCDDYN